MWDKSDKRAFFVPFSLPSTLKQPCVSSHNHSPPDVPIIITSGVKVEFTTPIWKTPSGLQKPSDKAGRDI